MDQYGIDIASVSCTINGTIWTVNEFGTLQEYHPRSLEVPCAPGRSISPVSSLSFKVTKLVVHPEAVFALLLGNLNNQAHVAVVTLENRGGADSAQVPYRESMGDLILHVSGVKVQKLEWIPTLRHYFAVLASNNRWGIYDARDPSTPLQIYKLSFHKPGGWNRSSGVAVSFDFSPRVAWGYFSAFFLRNDGSVFLVCPISIPNMNVSRHVIRDLMLTSDVVSRKWIMELFAPRPGEFQVCGELPDWWREEPSLKGPLNSGGASLLQKKRDTAVDLKVVDCQGVVVVFTFSAFGMVSVSLLEGDIGPGWSDQVFGFDLHRPMLAPEIVLRQASSRPVLHVVSQARIGRSPSSDRDFLVLQNGKNPIIGVIMHDKIILIHFPALKSALQDIQYRSLTSTWEPPTIKENNQSEEVGTISTVLGGSFGRNELIAVKAIGKDIMLVRHHIDEVLRSQLSDGNLGGTNQPTSEASDASARQPTSSDSDRQIQQMSFASRINYLQKFHRETCGSMKLLEMKLDSVGRMSENESAFIQQLDRWISQGAIQPNQAARDLKEVVPVGNILLKKVIDSQCLPMTESEECETDQGLEFISDEIISMTNDFLRIREQRES